MDNKFDLKKFLTENKLTANSKLLNEEIQIQPEQGDNENALPDYEDATYPVAQAFAKAGVDMSRPISIMSSAGRLQEKDPKQFAAELEAERKEFYQNLEPGNESMAIYEFENTTVDPVPDGLEYKLCFAVEGSHDYPILQAASGMNESRRRSSGRRLNESKSRTQSRRRS
jgi:hypothetical protein